MKNEIELLEEATKNAVEAIKKISEIQTPKTPSNNLDLGKLLELLRESFDDETLTLIIPTAVLFHQRRVTEGNS